MWMLTLLLFSIVRNVISVSSHPLRLQVSGIALWGCYLFFVKVYFGHVMSPIITLTKCLTGHRFLFEGAQVNAYVIVVVFVFVICIFVGQIMSPHDFKYLRGIWSCSEGVFRMVLTSFIFVFLDSKVFRIAGSVFNNGQSVSPLVTRSPYELSGDC